MTELFSNVLEETHRFRAALPELLAIYAGKWVVFEGGRVISVHQCEDDAYRTGMLQYGRQGSYIVDRVERKRATPLTAAVVYC